MFLSRDTGKEEDEDFTPNPNQPKELLPEQDKVKSVEQQAEREDLKRKHSDCFGEDLQDKSRGTDRAVPKPCARSQPHTSTSAPVVRGPPVPVTQQIHPQWNTSPNMAGGVYPAPQLQSPMDSQSHLQVFLSEVRTTICKLRMDITRLMDKVEGLHSKAGGVYPAPQLQSLMDSQSHLQVFLSEVRTTNSELRMGITRLMDKVEGLHSKLEDSEKRMDSESAALLHIKSQLQSVLSALDSRRFSSEHQPDAAPSPSYGHIPPSTSPLQCQSCQALHLEKTSLSEQLEKLNRDKEYLQTSLSAQKEALQNARIADKDQLLRIETLQKELDEARSRESVFNQSRQTIETEKSLLEENLRRANNVIAELQGTVGEKQTCIDKLEQALKDSEDTKIEEVRRNLQELDPRPSVADHVKRILNTVYKMVKLQFEPSRHYDMASIHSILADTFKGVTMQYLENGELFSDLLSSAAGKKKVSTVMVPPSSLPTSNPSLQNSKQVVSKAEGVTQAGRCQQVLSEGFSSPAQSTGNICVESQADTDRDVETPVISKANAESVIEGRSSKPQASVTPSQSPPSMDQVQEQMLRLMQADQPCDTIFNFISRDVGAFGDLQFIRALTTAVCEACIVGGSLKYEKFKEYEKLIQRFVDNKEDCELACLSSVHILMVRLQHPQGLIKSIFNHLLKDNIICCESFLKWRDDYQEVLESKGVSLMSLTSFFKALEVVDTKDETDMDTQEVWRPQPPPFFDEEENDDDWLN